MVSNFGESEREELEAQNRVLTIIGGNLEIVPYIKETEYGLGNEYVAVSFQVVPIEGTPEPEDIALASSSAIGRLVFRVMRNSIKLYPVGTITHERFIQGQGADEYTLVSEHIRLMHDTYHPDLEGLYVVRPNGRNLIGDVIETATPHDPNIWPIWEFDIPELSSD